MKIVVLDDYGLMSGGLDWSTLTRLGDVDAHAFTEAADVAERIAGADIVLTNKTVLDRTVLAGSPSLRFVGVLATGYNVVDVAAARELGIIVSNVPTYGTSTVSQYATALLLELCHRVGAHSADVRAGGWSQRGKWCYWMSPLVELHGKTAGIIGFGRIGREFGNIVQAMGMNVLAHDAYPDPSLESDKLRYASLEEVYAHSDVISLHCPLFETNRGMIDRHAIARMKDDAMLINTSRGPLVVEQDLADALNAGKLGGAALDVLAEEPPAPDNPLLAAKNCIVTPHMAWGTLDARRRIVDTVVANVAAYLAGQPTNVVSGS